MRYLGLIVAIFVLSTVHSRDLVQVNAAKMAIVICSAVVANTWFAVAGEITWIPAIALATGASAYLWVQHPERAGTLVLRSSDPDALEVDVNGKLDVGENGCNHRRRLRSMMGGKARSFL